MSRSRSSAPRAPSTRRPGPPHSRAKRATSAPNHGGIHLLRSPAVVAALVRAAELGPDDLVIELGAGPGILTAALACTGARVIAVERDPRFLRRLERRFGDDGRVRVVDADIRSVPLPRRSYAVVANIPFATSTRVLRRLLGDPRGRLSRAELVVEWGFAKRITGPDTGAREIARWHRRFDLELVRRIPRTSFSSPPRVDAAHLRIRRRRAGGSRADGRSGRHR